MPKTIPLQRQLTLGQVRELAKDVKSRHGVVSTLSAKVAETVKNAPAQVDAQHPHIKKLSSAARREARAALIREQIDKIYQPARDTAGLNLKELAKTKALLEQHGGALGNARAALDIASLGNPETAKARATYAETLKGLGSQAIRNLAGHALTEQDGVLLTAILAHEESKKPSDRAISPSDLMQEMGPDVSVEEGGFPIFDNYREFTRVVRQVDEAMAIGQALVRGQDQHDPLNRINRGLANKGPVTAPRQPKHSALDEQGGAANAGE